MSKYTSISKIIKTTYCEQQVVFDAKYGTKKDLSNQAQRQLNQKAEQGTALHAALEAQGRRTLKQQRQQPQQQSQDARCFVATCVFGYQAPETVWLRNWRDRVLAPNPIGRIAISIYYKMSPLLVHAIKGHPKIIAVTQKLMRRLMSAVGYNE
jgi:hypothetical protein